MSAALGQDAASRQPLLAVINSVMSLLAVVLLLPRADALPLALWLALMLAIQVSRLVPLALDWPTPGAPLSSLGWQWPLTTLGYPCLFAALSGIGWGIGGLAFHQVATVGEIGLMPLLICGMTAGAAISQAGHLPSFFGFCVPALSIYGAGLALGDVHDGKLMGLIILLYLLGTSVIAVQINKAVRKIITLGRERAHLVDELDSARHQLEREVRARTSELLNANDQLSTEIATRRRSEERIRHLLEHDALTNLPNRRLLMARLEAALHGKPEPQAAGDDTCEHGTVAVMMLDLDRFKEVNDTHGHPAGDSLLRQAADRLLQEMPAQATVARMGGDEFALLWPGFSGHQEVADSAERILQAFNEPFAIARSRIRVRTSIGVALHPEHGSDADTLLSHADQALYEAKSFGRGRYSFYSPELHAHIQAKHSLETGLRQALETGQLELRYQPRYTLRGQNLVAAEALLRWRHPELGYLQPAEFLPVAETTGLIDPIGAWVLDEACRQGQAWMSAGLSTRVAINLSPVQLQQTDIARQILEALDRAELPPDRLELEISELACAKGQAHLLERELRRIKGLGVRLAIDDFGRGSAPLALVKVLPFDSIKIDRSFIQRMHIDPRDGAIVKSILTLAKSLGWLAVAEGVEEEQQLDALIALGCDEAQGFLLGRPMRVAELQPMLVA